MIWILSGVLFVAGLVVFVHGYLSQRRPPSLRLHLLINEELMGIALMLAGAWTLLVYGLVEYIE
jgi:hypothetical protein